MHNILYLYLAELSHLRPEKGYFKTWQFSILKKAGHLNSRLAKRKKAGQKYSDIFNNRFAMERNS